MTGANWYLGQHVNNIQRLNQRRIKNNLESKRSGDQEIAPKSAKLSIFALPISPSTAPTDASIIVGLLEEKKQNYYILIRELHDVNA